MRKLRGLAMSASVPSYICSHTNIFTCSSPPLPLCPGRAVTSGSPLSSTSAVEKILQTRAHAALYYYLVTVLQPKEVELRLLCPSLLPLHPPRLSALG